MPPHEPIRRYAFTRSTAYSALLATVLAGLVASLVASSQTGAAGGPDRSAPTTPANLHLVDAQGPEWAALGILVFVLVLFGVAPGIAIGPVDTATAPLLERLGR